MKKINAPFDQKDRIICRSLPGSHEFYYQPAAEPGKRIFLMKMDSFSGSVFTFFRDKGREDRGSGYGLTIREFYKYGYYKRNPKLAKLFDRLPGLIEWNLRERLYFSEQLREYKADRHTVYCKISEKSGMRFQTVSQEREEELKSA